MSKPVTIAGRTERHCSKCGVVKPMHEFYVSRASNDGRGNRCKPCAKQAAKEHAERNPEARRAAGRKWAMNNPDKIKARTIINSVANVTRVNKWRKDNPDKVAAYLPVKRMATNVWKRNNADKIAAYYENNKPLLRSRVAKRRATRKNATPAWSDGEAIRSFYISADALNMLLGEWHHVDHIVPLQSKTVCGLHNEFNLQILTAKENQSKSNRHWPDKP